METSSISSILSEVTGVANINHGYTVTTTTHENKNGRISSYSSVYTVYDKTASMVEDSTPRYGSHTDVRV